MKRRYLAVYDYGTGGSWGYVRASSADEITERYPELQVIDQEPSWVTDEDRKRWERSVEDIDEPKRLGLLGIVQAGREPRLRPTATDRLLAWHRQTRVLNGRMTRASNSG